jgi:hypothetical protein
MVTTSWQEEEKAHTQSQDKREQENHHLVYTD